MLISSFPQLQGYNGQKASFSRTIQVKQVGHALLHLDKYNEDYLITLPSLHIEGLIYGSPFVELNKSTLIQSSSGYTARVDYSGKGWVSGKKNSFTAVVHRAGHEKDVLYTIDGQWSEAFVIKDCKTRQVLETYNAKSSPTTPLAVKPVDEQDPLESRRAWRQVAAAIQKGDMDTTGAEKSLIENQQRELRRAEQAESREWHRRYFSRVAKDATFDGLAATIGERVEPEKTGGIWRWDEKKHEAVLRGDVSHSPLSSLKQASSKKESSREGGQSSSVDQVDHAPSSSAANTTTTTTTTSTITKRASTQETAFVPSNSIRHHSNGDGRSGEDTPAVAPATRTQAS